MRSRKMDDMDATGRGRTENILMRGCSAPLDPLEIAKRLLYLPPTPEASGAVDRELVEDLVADIFRMHIPTPASIELAQTIRFMLVQGYVHRDPAKPATWRRIYSSIGEHAACSSIQLGAVVTGVSGAGKSTAIERALQLFPQVVRHTSMPGLAAPNPQLLWLKVDIPSSGKIRDLVGSLARATDEALGTSCERELFSDRRQSGTELAHRWLKKVSCNFLGVLVLDEVQNLFKIQTKAVRTAKSSRSTSGPPALRIVDDEALKFLLTLSNSAKIPTLYCATPDGTAALSTRMSTAQRMLTAGFHTIPHALSADDDFFRKRLFPVLCRYQWFPRRLVPSDELRRLVFDLSGGVPRLTMMLWFHATRRVLQRRGDGLSLDDFVHASEHALAPLRPAVQALMSDDPRLMQQYEDLMASI